MIRIIAVSIFLLLLGLPSSLFAETIDNEPSQNPIIITEIYANALGSSELGSEYIELHNAAENVVLLDDYYLTREGDDTQLSLDGLELAPGEYLAVITAFSLINSGGTVYLHYPLLNETEFVIEQAYPSLTEISSWSLIDNTWQSAMPTPSEANQIPDEEPVEEEPNETPPIVCDLSTVFINEIVANPAGSDSTGGEFVELYNDGTETVSLDGCLLTTDKTNNIQVGNVMLEPGSYYAIELFNDLLNDGGSVTFITHQTEYIIEYPALGDDDSWSLIDGTWQESTIMTPGAVNEATPQSVSLNVDEGFSPCPAGKFRNPETNRCKNIVDTASSLLPCTAGSARNPETNRCRKLSSSSAASLKPCSEGQERNPATNRCRKISNETTSLKPCEEGQERNPDTNRCRQVSQVLSGSTIDPPSQEAGLHTGVFMFMTMLVLAYGVYEYRLDFLNTYHSLQPKLKKLV